MKTHCMKKGEGESVRWWNEKLWRINGYL